MQNLTFHLKCQRGIHKGKKLEFCWTSHLFLRLSFVLIVNHIFCLLRNSKGLVFHTRHGALMLLGSFFCAF